MKYEFHALYDFASAESLVQQEAIAFLSGLIIRPPKELSCFLEVTDHVTRAGLLAQALATPHKDLARVGRGPKKPGGLLGLYRSEEYRRLLESRVKTLSSLGLATFPPNPATFPPGSWTVQFTFTLQEPYFSRDDTDFYVLENPVKKEWIFRVPYVAPTQWKGALRAAMVRRLVDGKENLSPSEFARRRLRLSLLFGGEKGEEVDGLSSPADYLDRAGGDEAARLYRKMVKQYFHSMDDEDLPHHAGRLHFYPTYFDCLDLEVINPHPRDTGAGELPIYFECVPAGAEGTFALFYAPFGRSGNSEAETRKEALEDLQMVAEGIQFMMTGSGFGARTSSGFGVAEERIREGIYQVKGRKPAEFSTLSELVGDVKRQFEVEKNV
ncbi:CRISPR-associated protein [Desulfofundulus thermobenzoicus]|uniref:CRISPR-associated protein n=1 Tax=Desulfofundulus thermobenzoicus TaxID=29376 RepID=A0A6N7IRW2_9FIRM|nr:RAMP superfamily CRISPR-associated protein [Desulfofundulus thermobenzoicus]MQL52303.1 CRISPR-associated protein [Desulfofundulus thermobenzoicus]